MKGKVFLVTIMTAASLAALLGAGPNAAATSDDVQDEQQLISVLKSDADWLAKQEACRGLRRIGTQESIPALAALLNDEKLSHLARYALEPMPYPEAGQALRDALATTTGKQKTGMVISLGERRDVAAVPLLTPLLDDPDVDTARATAGALGRIATPAAVKALLKFRGEAPDSVVPALADGLLAAGERLVQADSGKQAAKIYKALLESEWPVHARMGAFYGLAYAEPHKAPSRIVKALGGDDPVFRDLAAQIVAETSGAKDTRVYAAALPKLPSEGQVALLRGLGDRRDPLAGAAALNLIAVATEKPVKIAAIRALGNVGVAADVTALVAQMESSDPGIASAAQEALKETRIPEADAIVAGLLSGANLPPEAQARLLELLTERMAEQAVPMAVQCLGRDGAPVRISALHTLAQLGGAEQVPAIVTDLTKTTDDSERGAAGEALSAIAKLQGENVLPVLLDAMGGANQESRIVLLSALGQVGGPKALEPVVAAMNDTSGPVSEAAIRVLASWPTADAAPQLLNLAQSDSPARRDPGLRGYVRLARDEKDAGQKSSMLNTAMNLASKPEEKWLVLGAWGTLPSKAALDTLRPHLDDAAVRNEAAAAMIAVASQLGKQNEEGKAQAIDALKAVIAQCDDQGTRDRAQKALTGFGG